MNVSIIAACTPTLYHVLSSFSAGFAGLHIPENLELSVNRSKHTRSQTKSGGSAGNGGILSTSNKIDDYPRHVQGPFDEGYGMSYGHQAEVRASRDGAGSTESTRGLTRSESLGVVKTVDIWVDVERQDRSD